MSEERSAAAKRRVTFEVDPAQLFDTLAAMKGDVGPLGERLVETLLARPNTADLIGMAFYGVQVAPEPSSARDAAVAALDEQALTSILGALPRETFDVLLRHICQEREKTARAIEDLAASERADAVAAAEAAAEARGRVAGLAEGRSRIAELEAMINHPELADWFDGVRIEAAHQVERWGSAHDAGKAPLDWFWLIGYLAQKATHAHLSADLDRAKHHTISTGAALFNWHRHLSGQRNGMRPGIMPPAAPTQPARGAMTEPIDSEETA